MSKGLFLGKFMPFHLGHKFTADFGSEWVDELTILVCSTEYEPIDGVKRFNIVKQVYAGNSRVRVVHLYKNMPQEPSEHPDFWNIWKTEIERIDHFDIVFSSEEYGFKLAEVLGAKHIMVDQSRSIAPVSGTAIRNDLIGNWNLLPPETQEVFAQRFCIVGPESTGKTTLSKKLSNIFNGIFLPEYGRIYYENKVLENPDYQYECKIEEIEDIAKGHYLYEKQSRFYPLLFADTDAIITKIFSEIYFGSVPKIVEECIEKRSGFYSLYLVTTPNVAWVSDGQRDLESKRWRFWDMTLENLEKYKRPYKIIDADDWDEREDQAKSSILGVLTKTLN